MAELKLFPCRKLWDSLLSVLLNLILRFHHCKSQMRVLSFPSLEIARKENLAKLQ